MNRHPAFQLKSGELLISRKPGVVSTVLGSCVAVTFFSRRPATLAAMCHAMLPTPGPLHDPAAEPGENFKYVTLALPAMIDAFLNEGIPIAQIEAKVFGGANVLGSDDEGSDTGIGSANVEMTLSLLQEFGVPLRASNVGGFRGRKILFDTNTGEVLHKFLGQTPPPPCPVPHPRRHHALR